MTVMATPRRKPTSAAGKKKAPARRITVKPTPPKSVPGSKGGFTAMMREAEKKHNPTQAAPQKDPNSLTAIVGAVRAIYGDKKVNVLDVPYMERDVARVLGADYIERLKVYVIAGDIVPERLQQYLSADFSYLRWVQDQINGRISPVSKGTGKPFTLRPHQQEGVDTILRFSQAGWRGFLVADETGLGKSLTGLLGVSQAAAAKGFTAQRKAKLLIICPNNVIPHWKNTIRQSGVDNLRILVINYEQYKKLLTVPKEAQAVKKTKTKNKHTAQSGKPFITWNYIICDESHKIKNYTSQRTQAFEKVAEYSQTETAKAPFVLWMSATAGQDVLELGYLAPLVGQAVKKPLTIANWGDWLYDNNFHVKKKGETWTWVKPTSPQDAIAREQQREDVHRLSEIIFHPKAPSLRRRPQDIQGWPEVNRIALPVQLGVDSQKTYDKLWTEFRKTMKLGAKGKNPKGALVEQLRFSQKASLLRAPQTVENIIEQLENGYQVAVSVRFIETLESIKTSLIKLGVGVSEFSGRTFINNEHERILFQKGVNRVILFTVEEGVSFHAKEQLPDGSTASASPRATLIHDLRYSGLSMTQIIGRTHRDGQLSNAYFMYAEGTVEKRILDIMLNKMQNMSTLVGDTEEDAILEILEYALAA
jgi:hypothetical protein